jgi:hypothetical protein
VALVWFGNLGHDDSSVVGRRWSQGGQTRRCTTVTSSMVAARSLYLLSSRLQLEDDGRAKTV